MKVERLARRLRENTPATFRVGVLSGRAIGKAALARARANRPRGPLGLIPRILRGASPAARRGRHQIVAASPIGAAELGVRAEVIAVNKLSR